jgi:hypothetical protein
LEVLDMNKIHVTVVSALIGLSGMLGIAAATDTVGLRASAPAKSVSSAEIAARAKRLAKAEKAIRKARKSKPPALPAVPASRASSAPSRQQVVFQRSAPVASTSHSGGDDDEDHSGHGHGGDDHGGDDD